jgi:D-arabinose 1-dehydrogenase-like Zn-dependent alcohol dehydrogenase
VQRQQRAPEPGHEFAGEVVEVGVAVSAAGLALRRPSTEGLLVATLAALSTAVAAVLVVLPTI